MKTTKNMDSETQINLVADRILHICRDVLGMPTLTSKDSLMAKGVNSLRLMILASKLERALKSPCPFSLILKADTAHALATEISKREAVTASGSTSFAKAETRALYPLSRQQRHIYVDQQKDVNSTKYNLPLVIGPIADIDPSKLQHALSQLVARHDILRTSFVFAKDLVWARVIPQVPIVLTQVVEAHGVSLEVRFQSCVKPFDLHDGPLWRLFTVKSGSDTFVVFDIHHILTDAISLALLVAECEALYSGQPLTMPDYHYRDYVDWSAAFQKSDRAGLSATFWKEQFPELPAALNLPIDHPRGGNRVTAGSSVRFDLNAIELASISTAALEAGVTVASLLLSAFGMTLAGTTEAATVVVGVPVNGRIVAETERMQGLIVNTLPIKIVAESNSRLVDIARRTALEVGRAIQHQEFDVIGYLTTDSNETRDFGRNPLFDTLFAYQDTGLSDLGFLSGEVRVALELTDQTMFELNLQARRERGGISFEWFYRTDLYEHSTVGALRDEFLRTIHTIVARPNDTFASTFQNYQQIRPQAIELNF